MDGHPRRITPIPISVNIPIPAINVKSPDQLMQETTELIQRHEQGKKQQERLSKKLGEKVSIEWVISQVLVV